MYFELRTEIVEFEQMSKTGYGDDVKLPLVVNVKDLLSCIVTYCTMSLDLEGQLMLL